MDSTHLFTELLTSSKILIVSKQKKLLEDIDHFLGYRSVVCLSVCLSVTFVHCAQTLGRIKTKLGMQVGLGPGYIVLDGDPAPLPQRGTAPQFSAHICCAAKWLHGSRCHLVWS